MNEMSAALSIIRARHYNDTWATLLAASGETVEVKNGRAYLIEARAPVQGPTYSPLTVAQRPLNRT